MLLLVDCLCSADICSEVAGTLYLWTSYVTGLNWWLFSFLVTYKTLGGVWLIVGLLSAGVGVIPLAVIGEVVRRTWYAIPWLLATSAMGLGPWVLGMRLRHLKREISP
jgi:hypothetical protein